MADFDFDFDESTLDAIIARNIADGMYSPEVRQDYFNNLPGTVGGIDDSGFDLGKSVPDILESPSLLDQIISGGKKVLSDITPDAIKALLGKAGGFASANPLLTGGLGGAALMALLSSMNKGNQQQAPQYTGLGFSGPAPAAAAPQFVQMPSQAQSYSSMMGMKDGGAVHMQSGDFVFSKKAMDKVGGIDGLRKRGYPAQKISGPGTGTSDSIPATIDGKPVARVANGEALIPGGAKMKGLAGLHSRMRKGK